MFYPITIKNQKSIINLRTSQVSLDWKITFGGSEQYKKDTLKWLKQIDLEEIKDFILE